MAGSTSVDPFASLVSSTGKFKMFSHVAILYSWQGESLANLANQSFAKLEPSKLINPIVAT